MVVSMFRVSTMGRRMSTVSSSCPWSVMGAVTTAHPEPEALWGALKRFGDHLCILRRGGTALGFARDC